MDGSGKEIDLSELFVESSEGQLLFDVFLTNYDVADFILEEGILKINQFDLGEVQVEVVAMNEWGLSSAILFTVSVLNPSQTESIKDDIAISAYPNPVVDEYTIALSNVPAEEVDIIIFNNSGQIVQLNRNNLNSSEGLIICNLLSLTPGLYFVQIRAEEHVYSVKFIKE